ncbi:putative membrane protein YcfT [Microbacterium sp. SORGH_AS428]|uniref:acyltransferase family protein n=1 Tax=Microbacterium sp. SORGH_AS_0428 TaxID=3041788 RepID=UPI002862F9F6|nr:acyltransferase family protein [Microbacterium sp. SORGH_AS_0428]MDR6199902.1 putative membrane protein YcfT [Microbacterium sp. SORGH_AS_0428]
MPDARPPVRAERLAWPDAARGLSVTLIVILHMWASHLIFWIGNHSVMGFIEQLVDWTSPLRIPLFFFVSGYLASRSLQKPWQAAWRGRVFAISYLYVLWVALIAGFIWIDNTANGFDAESPLGMMLRNVGSPETHMWYLWALVVLFIAVWLTRRVPAWIVVSVGAVISVAAPFILEQPYRQVAAAALFFSLGARLPVVTEWLTSRRGTWIFLAGSAVYVGSVLLGPTGPYGLADPLTSTVGVAAMVAIISTVAHQRWMAVFRRIGRNTLPIFILNPLVFLLLNDLLRSLPNVSDWLARHTEVGALYSIAVILATFGISLGLKAAADRIGMRWLFSMPARWFPVPVRS